MCQFVPQQNKAKQMIITQQVQGEYPQWHHWPRLMMTPISTTSLIRCRRQVCNRQHSFLKDSSMLLFVSYQCEVAKGKLTAVARFERLVLRVWALPGSKVWGDGLCICWHTEVWSYVIGGILATKDAWINLYNDKILLIPWVSKRPIFKVNYCSEFLSPSVLPWLKESPQTVKLSLSLFLTSLKCSWKRSRSLFPNPLFRHFVQVTGDVVCYIGRSTIKSIGDLNWVFWTWDVNSVSRVLNRERLKESGCSSVFNELLTKKVPTFLSRL